ncbi:MAG: hypothetical protein M3016_07850 [Actinomycetota bacterium]|nr:hypothetical protein [Actinomycetota bacterium]
MRTSPRATSADLRRAVDCLPRRTRIAMLAGIAANPIIVGAYSTSDGVCPMLAAHRAGGRTSLIAFARAWDRFAFRGSSKRGSRRATERELRVLKTYLEASLLADEAPGSDLAAARREHLELLARRQRPAVPRRPGDPDRSVELGGRSGWAWTRLVRRHDDYERLLEQLHSGSTAVVAPERRAVSPQR